MAELRKCEFFLLRYVPDAVRQQFVEFGVVLTEPTNGPGSGFAAVRFSPDWRQIARLDPNADLEYLDALKQEIQEQINSAEDARNLLGRFGNSFSHVVQLTPLQVCETADPQQEIEQLARYYLQPITATARKQAGARQGIVRRMRSAFEDAGVWQYMEKAIAVEQYTHEGDPLKIDCGYKPNGVVKLFHAVPLTTDTDLAKVLAFSLPRIEAGILRVRDARTELTAVVEDKLDLTDAAIAFALGTLRESRISVASVSQLPDIAENVRLDLKL